VPRWRESEAFTPLELDVLEYAEAMTNTPPTVTDDLSGRLLDRLGPVAMTEDPFVAHRSLLFTVAFEMLGSAADAEDVLQESWLRWGDIDHSQVRDPRAYLIRVVTRQALNQMRTLSRRREEYVGEWLPEPLLTSPDVAEDVELAESGSAAAGAGESVRAAGHGRAVPGRFANRAVAGADGGHGARRGPDRRWWRACGRRSVSDLRG
jgi:hypothetical protein